MGKYLSANEKGELTAQADEKGANEQWTVLAQSDGRWVFQGPHGYYFGGSGDNLSCFAREYGETEMWTIHLAMHPQVNKQFPFLFLVFFVFFSRSNFLSCVLFL